MPLGPFGGFREDQILAEGLNTFTIEAFGGSGALATETLEVTLDSNFSTEDRPLLYHHGESNETIIVDLEAGTILGVMPGIRIVAATNDGRFAIASDGNVYHTSNHTLRATFPNLGFGSPVYPFLSRDDRHAYADDEKRGFATGALLSGAIADMVDNRFATRLPGDRLAQSDAAFANIIDLSTDSIVSTTSLSMQRVNYGTSIVDPSGTYAFVTSYSFARGAIDVVALGTSAIVHQADLLSDYMGQVAFTADGTKALVGSYGNSFFGDGGIYVIDLAGFQLLQYYEQYGASSLALGLDGLVYTSSRFVDHFGNGTVLQGSPARRGIDVLQLTGDGQLEYVKTYYFNYPHRYETKSMFFIKAP